MDEEKWNEILRQWEGDDAEEAADDLESGKDAMDLASPGTWAEHDLAKKPMQGPAQVESFETSTVSAPLRLRPEAPRATMPPAPAVGTPPKSMGESSTPAAGASPSKMDWVQLKNALTNADLRAMQTRAGESMRANIVQGYKPDLEGGQLQRATARIPLEVANAQQNFEAKESATGVKKAMDDPHSLQSQKAREAWRAFGLKTPPGFDNWSAADIQRNVGPAQNAAQRDQHGVDAAAKATADAAKAADSATRRKEDLDYRERSLATADKNADATRALAARGLENRETEAAAKKTEDIPPGYEIAPDGNPGTDSRKKFTALVASQQKLKGLTKKMREMTGNMTRIDRITNFDALNQLATQIGIEGKNVADLGALSGPDMDLMEAMVQNPTKAWNIFRDSDVAKNMAGLDSWADESVKAGEKSYGLRRKGGGGAKVTPSGRPYARKQQNVKTGAVRYLDEAGGVVEESGG